MMRLGQTVRDRVTGFQGVVTGHVEYLTGCAQELVQPRVKLEGDFVESRWFDETRLEVVGAIEPVVIDPKPVRPGADIPAPRR